MLIIAPTEIRDLQLPGSDGIVLIIDHQPPPLNPSIEADFETGKIYSEQSYNRIEEIIKDYNIAVKHVYMNHYLYWPDFPYPHTCVPHLAFFKECAEFSKNSIVSEYSDEQKCFVMMNKRRENRLLVSAWFNQNNHIDFDYTQGWDIEDDDFSKIQEYTRLTDYSFDGFLNKKFIPNLYWPSELEGSVRNMFMWNNLLKEKFCSSTFTVISEPIFWEKACSITEKYLQALYGCCFPIFCGGYKLPEQLTLLGFDLFDDIIDHSYQYELHPGLRVINALELNRKLLENSDIKKLDYMDRHLKNLSIVKENLDKFIAKFDDIQTFVIPNSRNWYK